MFRRIFAAAVICAATVTHNAGAQEIDAATRNAARELATEGSTLYEANDFEQAYDRFNRAYQLVRVPTVGLWSARSLVKAGRWVEAAERYLEIERTELPEGAPADHARAREEAAAERKELLPRIPAVRITVEGADASEVFVTLDGVLVQTALLGVKRPVNPGKRRVKGLRGEKVVEASFDLAEGEFREVKLVFPQAPAQPAAQPAPSAPSAAASSGAAAPITVDGGGLNQRTLGFVALGVGGAALVTGSVFGVLALSQQSDLESKCPRHECEPPFHSDVDDYELKKTIAGAGLVAGVVLGATGAVLLLTAPSAVKQGPQIGAFFDGSRAGLVGAF